MPEPHRNLPVPSVPQLPAPARGSDPMSAYLAEVRRYPILDADEERRLAIAYYEEGDRSAGERLVCCNLRLVLKIAFQYHRRWANLLDLVQEGNIGLLEALRRYDPYREVRFSSYAAWWIRAMILRFLLDNFGAVKFGGTRAGRKLFFQLRKERERLLQQGIEPTTRALADRLGVSEIEVQRVESARMPALSLDAPVGAHEDRPLLDTVADGEQASPEDEAAVHEVDGRMRRVLQAFEQTLTDPRELAIWRRHTTAVDPCSLADLGREYGVSKERIRQIEARLRDRLRVHVERAFGRDVEIGLG